MENLQNILSHIWNVIVESNIFNFVIFVFAFGWIFKKINLKGIIDSLQIKIVEIIETAKKAKADAQKELSEAEKATANLESELKTIVQEAEKSAEVIGKKILEEAEKQVENISSNIQKVIGAEEKMLVSKLTHNTSKASVQIAKSNIEEALVQNPNLHQKFIDESIDSLDGLNFTS